MARNRRPRRVRRPRQSAYNFRFNPEDGPDLDAPVGELTAARKKRGERTGKEAEAPMPANPGQGDCIPEKVSAVLIPVNETLISWARAEADSLPGSGLSHDAMGRLLVIASLLKRLPRITPSGWQANEGPPRVELKGESRKVFLSHCAESVDESTPVYIVSVSSARSAVGQLTGFGEDFDHPFGLPYFILGLVEDGPLNRFGVQLLLPEDYIQEVSLDGVKTAVPTFFSADFYEGLHQTLARLLTEAGKPWGKKMHLTGLMTRAEGARKKATRIVRTIEGRAGRGNATQEALDAKTAQINARIYLLLNTCLLRLGPTLDPSCYFPKPWTHRAAEVVPVMRRRAIENLISKVLMAEYAADPKASRFRSTPYFDVMKAKVKDLTRGSNAIRTRDQLIEWVAAQKKAPAEAKAVVAYNHTVVKRGVRYPAPMSFSFPDGRSFVADNTEQVISHLVEIPGAKHSQTDALFVVWSPSPDVIIYPTVEGVSPEAMSLPVVDVPDRKGDLTLGAQKGEFTAGNRTALAKKIKVGATRRVTFSGSSDVFVLTAVSAGDKETTFRAFVLPEAVAGALDTIQSGPPLADEIFSVMSVAESINAPGVIGPKDYAKAMRAVAGKMEFAQRPPAYLTWPSAKQEDRQSISPALRLEMFPDPNASDYEFQKDIIPLVASVKQYPTLRDALVAPSARGEGFAAHMAKRAEDAGADLDKTPSATLPPLVLYAAAYRKPIKGAPRGVSLGSDVDPRTLYFFTADSAPPEKSGGSSMLLPLQITDHHRALLHHAFDADVQFRPDGKIDFVERGAESLNGQLRVTPLADPEFFRNHAGVLRVMERLREKEEAKKAKGNPEGGPEAGGPKFSYVKRTEPTNLEDEERLYRQAVATYLSYLFMPSPYDRELGARRSRAEVTGNFVRQAVRIPGQGIAAKASQSAARWAIPATKRSAPEGWEPNLIGLVRDADKLYSPTEMDITNADYDVDEMLLNAAFDTYGVPVEGETAEAKIEALKRLRAEVLNSPVQTFGREELEFTPAPRIARYGSQEEGFDYVEAPEDEFIARLNPDDDDTYIKYLKEQFAGEQDPATVPDATIDFRGVRGAFPTSFKGRADLKPERFAERIGTHGKFVQHGRRRDVDDFALTAYQSQLASQAGLSVPETKRIIGRMSEAYGRRFKSTIPASSAMCAVSRVKKLAGYRIPGPMMLAGPLGYERKKVIVWVSPEDATKSRVMVYRRNTHIDCDIPFGGGNARSLGQAIALGLQDVLLWLGQRESRLRDTYVYVGRVGVGKLNLAWSPGQDLSFEGMLQQLDNDKGSIQVTEYVAKEDVAKYRRAEVGSLGGVPTETPRAPQTARPAEPPREAPEDNDDDKGEKADGGAEWEPELDS